MTKSQKTYLDTLLIPPEYLTSSADLRYTLTDTLKTLLQQTNHNLITPPKITPNPETFLNTLKTNPKIYHASMSRQFAADLPPDIEQTALKDEPKDWYIKTADYGDDYDRVLQHRDGEYTQLLEDLAIYHQILQEHCDRIIVLRSPNYGGYDTLINAAMQCLGYTQTQFQFIIVQPIQLYAFHKPSQKLHALPDLHPNELLKAIGMEALRWYCFSTPLTKVAPINISTAGKLDSNDTFALVQFTYQRCSNLVQQAKAQGIKEAIVNNNLETLRWESTDAAKLASLVESTPKILEQSSTELAPNLICRHLEIISQICSQWFETLNLSQQTYLLLSKIKETMQELLEILSMKT